MKQTSCAIWETQKHDLLLPPVLKTGFAAILQYFLLQDLFTNHKHFNRTSQPTPTTYGRRRGLGSAGGA